MGKTIIIFLNSNFKNQNLRRSAFLMLLQPHSVIVKFQTKFSCDQFFCKMKAIWENITVRLNTSFVFPAKSDGTMYTEVHKAHATIIFIHFFSFLYFIQARLLKTLSKIFFSMKVFNRISSRRTSLMLVPHVCNCGFLL